MLAVQNRLKKRKSFNYINRKGKRISGDLVTLVFVPARVRDVKVGFSVSKKVGNSVVRHRVTRQMRSAMRLLIDGVWRDNTMIFSAKENIVGKTMDEIREDMERVLIKAKLLG